MSSRKLIDDFISKKNLAIIGVSRNKKKFGNYICKELKKKGYSMFPIHPSLEEFDGLKCYASLDRLPNSVDGVILNIPPYKAKETIAEVAQNGIKRIWLQQGSSNDEVIKECESKNLDYIENECIIMYAEPVESFHKFHRFIWKLTGKYKK